MIKVLGVGDRTFGDDGIGISVIENLRTKLRELDTCVITGARNDKSYFKELKKDDFLIVVDSGCFGKNIGGITNISLSKCDDIIDGGYMSEENNLISVLRTDYRDTKGVLVAIEILNAERQSRLSEDIEKCFDKICNRVLNIIKYLVDISS